MTAFCCLAFLSGCSGDSNNNTNVSSSSISVSSSSKSTISVPASSSHSLGSSSSSYALSESPYVGQWYAPAYGYVLSVTTEGTAFTVKTYSVTTDYCLLQKRVSDVSHIKLEQEYVYSNSGKEILLKKNGDYPPGVDYEKVDKLPLACTENLQILKADSGYSFDAKKDFEIFWQTFNDLYINFELRGVNWNAVYEDAIKSVDTIKDETELFEFLSELTVPLGDGHALLIRAPLSLDLDKSITAALENDETPSFNASTQLTLYEKLLNEYLQMSGHDGESTSVQTAAAENYIVENFDNIVGTIFDYADQHSVVKVRAAGQIAWFKTSNNIGYLFVGSMSDYTEGKSTLISDIASDVAIAEATINEALKDLEGTDGLIVDVRFNDGGQDQVALNFVRHFMGQSQVVYSKFAGRGAWATPVQDVMLDPHKENIYLKPTAVLTSGDTGSAAELFTIAMASLSQVTIIGEPTAGAFSDILVKRLTSDILFGVSNETYLDVQGNNYEKIGIPPKIPVPFATLQERVEGYDAGIESAINWIEEKR